MKFFTFFYFLIFTKTIVSQSITLPKDILLYQQRISLAKNQMFCNLDSSIYYFKKANEIKPIHYFHLMFLKNLISRKFDKELFEIIVYSEVKQFGISQMIKDTTYIKNLSSKNLERVKVKSKEYLIMYIENVDNNLVRNFTEVYALDQFARSSFVRKITEQCENNKTIRNNLINYVDTTYFPSLIKYIEKNESLKTESFGGSYTDFMVLCRHLNMRDSVKNLVFLKKILENFIITPDYYANLIDYVFNSYRDQNGIVHFKNTFAEYGVIGNNDVIIDNPELIDRYRVQLGLLPLWDTCSDKNKLPIAYKLYYERVFNINK